MKLSAEHLLCRGKVVRIENSFQVCIEERYTVRIVDVSGKLRITKELVANEIIEVDVFSQGLYIVRIANSRGIFQKKIVKR